MDEFTNVRSSRPVEPDPVMPDRLVRRPWSKKHKTPIPWFVQIVDGEPDFRVVSTNKMVIAVQKNLCWICGERLGTYISFVLGPMCMINRISAEPPSHKDCAIYAARVCPFLAHPNKERRTAGLPSAVEPGPGLPLLHNPGVALVWVCLGFRPMIEGEKQNKLLFDVGDPVELLWYTEGRTATRVEVEAAINMGLPILQEEASKEGLPAMAALASAIDIARCLLPNI